MKDPLDDEIATGPDPLDAEIQQDIDPRMPYQQTPAGQAVAQRYGVLPSQQQEARDIVSQDIQSIPRVTAKTMVRGLPAAGGAIIGSGLGPLGAVAGGGLGYSIGGRLEELLGLEDRPASIPEAMGKAAADVQSGAMYEMGGQGVGGVLNKLLAPRAGQITPQGTQLQETLGKAGVQANPIDVAPGRGLRALEALSQKQVGGGRITDAAQNEIRAMRGDPTTGTEGWLAKEASRVSGTQHQLDASRVSRGETIQSGLKEMATINRELSGVEWEMLKIHDTGVPDFPLTNLREAMRQKMAQAGIFEQVINPGTSSRLTSSGGSAERGTWRPESTRGASGGARTYRPDEPGPRPRPRGANEPFVTESAVHGVPESEIVSGVARGEGPVTFEGARSMRSALGKLYDKDPKTWGSALKGFNQDMEAYAALNPSRAADYAKARQVTREQVVPFNRDQPLGQLIDKNEPMSVVNEMMQPRDSRIHLVRAVKQQTGGKGPVWEAVNSEAMTRSLEDPRMLTNMGRETRRELFTPEQGAFLDELQNWVQTTSAIKKVGGNVFAGTGQNVVALEGVREGIGAAKQFASLVLGGGAAAAGGGSVLGILAGGTIALSPVIVARMLTNPTAARYLTEGIRTPVGSPEALRIASQLVPAYFKAVGDEERITKERELQRLLKGGR